ncbi:MAG: class F sortase [Chloroflexi bacterium]|nr:class F sortase [Chloroflexota bacterium]
MRSVLRAGGHTRPLPFLLVLVLMVLPFATGVARAASLEYPIEDGYGFGTWQDPEGVVRGYAVSDEGGLGFWSSYRALGGRSTLGGALSERYACGESVCQAFERAILRWDSATAEALPLAEPTMDAGTRAIRSGAIPARALATRILAPSTAPAPTRLVVPKVRLDVSIRELASGEEELPAPPTPAEVAWYDHSAGMGEGGNMVLAGHVDWVGQPAVFANLWRLEPGDDLWLSADGVRARYRVTETASYPYTSLAVSRAVGNGGRGEQTLTLITCGGPFDIATGQYLERLVVRAVTVDEPMGGD